MNNSETTSLGTQDRGQTRQSINGGEKQKKAIKNEQFRDTDNIIGHTRQGTDCRQSITGGEKQKEAIKNEQFRDTDNIIGHTRQMTKTNKTNKHNIEN